MNVRSALLPALLLLLLTACGNSQPLANSGAQPPPTEGPPTGEPGSDEPPPPDDPPTDVELAPAALQAQLSGCDLIDPSNCLLPFPNDHFTVPAADGSIQSIANGGTGKRIDMRITATPRNVAGKPVDPTEWNRSDGFSPGALIVTYVPGLSLTETFGLPAEKIGIVNPALSLDPKAPILVLEVAPDAAPTPHLVISELDANAGTLLESQGEFQDIPVPAFSIPSPNPRSALLIRPAKNFTEGKRYVVVLRKLKDGNGERLIAQPGFRACRDQFASALPAVNARCSELEANVFPALEAAGIERDSNLYLAWDFTVGSTQNEIGRLRHMRNQAFKTLADGPGVDCLRFDADHPELCRAPQFTVDTITPSPREGIARRIEGTITVPSFVVPSDPSPAESVPVGNVLQSACDALPGDGDAKGEACDLLETLAAIAASGSAPPNRLYYSPEGGTADPSNLDDPLGVRFGDNLPDQLPLAGTMTTRYLCQIPEQASGVNRARAGVYGHGLLDSRAAVNYDGVPDMSTEFNYMFCAVDFFGFATGDLPNVLTTLVDLSNFAVIPDGSQQGFVNFMYLVRLLKHPQGFAANAAFQDDAGLPVFDPSHVFYDGNSQGGILGGVLIAADQDIERGALGSLGMNYSTLLNRSKDFDQYAIILYASYQDPLERQLLFSMMQMLWDRSENDGYAAHLTDNSAFGGAPKVVKLDPNFGDQQVTEWSAEVMARTMGIPADYSMSDRVAEKLGTGQRQPDVHRGYALTPLDYADPQQITGGALVVWDDERSAIPPIENIPPRPDPPLDRDPHDDSAKKHSGRCQKAHFLRDGGTLIDIKPVEFDGAECPPVPAP